MTIADGPIARSKRLIVDHVAGVDDRPDFALVCFAIGALKNLSGAGRIVDKIDWLCAGIFFVVLGWGFFLR